MCFFVSIWTKIKPKFIWWITTDIHCQLDGDLEFLKARLGNEIKF